MFHRSEIPTVIETESGPISTKDFSYFLYLFRAIYVLGYREALVLNSSELSENEIISFTEKVKKKMVKLDWTEVRNLALFDLDKDSDLAIEDISRRNPLDALLVGLAPPIIAAAIIAGGSFRFSPSRITVPSPKRAIDKMRAAFGLPPIDRDRP